MIDTLDALVAGIMPSTQFYKTTGAMEAAGLWHSTFYGAGMPGPAAAPTPGLAGEALTSYAGQIPFPAAVGGEEIRLARIDAVHTSSLGALSLMDRLWHNSGFVVTSTSAQTINSVTLPARDVDGATAGRGVMLAMEVTTTTGAGTPTLTVTYTNSAGVSGRTGTIGPVVTTLQAGTFYPMNLQAGDVGVRSVQSIQSSATMTSGAVSFVLYREIVTLPFFTANYGVDRDAMALGLPKMFDNSVPFFVGLAVATTTTTVDGSVTWARG